MINDFKIKLPADAVIGNVERVFESSYQDINGVSPKNLKIDLSNCEYIDLPVLFYLIAHISDRKRSGMLTKLCLPNRDVRNFLRAWHFPQTIENMSGLPFRDFVQTEDLKFFGENRGLDLKDIKYVGLVKDGYVWGGKSLEMLQITSNEKLAIYNIARKESSKYNTERVRQVLAEYFVGSDNYIASHIIHEAVMNSLRHPKAECVVTSSFLDVPKDCKKGKKAYLTLVFWDDGNGIPDTLMSALKKGEKIRNEKHDFHAKYKVVFEDEDSKRTSFERDSSFTPSLQTEAYETLLAAIFPGITRDPTGVEHCANTGLSKSLDVPGLGLFILANTAVDIFGGQVAIRTKNLFMNVKANRQDKMGGAFSYCVKIKRFCDKMPNFMGNMITVRLPLSFGEKTKK